MTKTKDQYRHSLIPRETSDSDDKDVESESSDNLVIVSDDDEDEDEDEDDRTGSRKRRKKDKLDFESRAAMKKFVSAFGNSLFGQCLDKLEKLIRQFVTISFNGASYDFPILCRYITKVLYSKKQKLRMQKEGSNIRYMRLRGVKFIDIRHLLSPGFSLDKFGKACDLKVEKGYFPWKMLTSAQFLEEPELPGDEESWASDLGSSRSLDREGIDSVLRTYRSMGCCKVGDYLAYYLQKDVLILQRASLKLRDSFLEVINVDFVANMKYTVASLASYAMQNQLASGKRPGFFSPNHTRLYQMLRGSLRGGEYCVVGYFFLKKCIGAW